MLPGSNGPVQPTGAPIDTLCRTLERWRTDVPERSIVSDNTPGSATPEPNAHANEQGAGPQPAAPTPGSRDAQVPPSAPPGGYTGAYGQPPAQGAYPPPPAGAYPAAGQSAYPPAYGAPGASPGYPAYGAAPAYGYGAQPKTNVLAIVSLIASIVGLIGILPIIGSIGAVVTGHISLHQLKTSGENGRGMALAGTIVGYVGLGLWIIGMIVVFSLLAWAASQGGRVVYSSL